MNHLANSITTLALILLASAGYYFSVSLNHKIENPVVGVDGTEYKGLLLGNFEGWYFLTCDGKHQFEVTEIPDIRGREKVGAPDYQDLIIFLKVKGIAVGSSSSNMFSDNSALTADSDIKIKKIIAEFDGESEGCYTFDRYFEERYKNLKPPASF